MNEEGLTVARRFARWHLGDPSWAGEILWAYANPEAASKKLDEEMA